MFEDFETKKSVVIAYTGDGKGKTSASLGLTVRALGTGWSVAFIQFVKFWKVNEHTFFDDIKPIYKDRLYFFKGGKGFYDAGDLSAKGITEEQHKQAAAETLAEAKKAIKSKKYQLVVCDEINNAVHDGLLTAKDLEELIDLARKLEVNLCLTGRDFPKQLIDKTDIATDMTKIKHHFDEKFLANVGIDY